ncbi:MAG: hypothetical protein IJ440_01715 [Alphaproteobacteria bacterium]|nr:hypothetical protein [Alphaproteobacteria bacterium]
MNEMSAIQQIENLEAFDPIVYKKGKRTFLFAKQNNRLFRIIFSTSHPAFFVLTPTKIEPMTEQDIFSIMNNYCSMNEDIEDKLSYFPQFFREFNKNKPAIDNNQAPFIYEKACQIIYESPNFQSVVKKEIRADKNALKTNKESQTQPDSKKTKPILRHSPMLESTQLPASPQGQEKTQAPRPASFTQHNNFTHNRSSQEMMDQLKKWREVGTLDLIGPKKKKNKSTDQQEKENIDTPPQTTQQPQVSTSIEETQTIISETIKPISADVVLIETEPIILSEDAKTDEISYTKEKSNEYRKWQSQETTDLISNPVRRPRKKSSNYVPFIQFKKADGLEVTEENTQQEINMRSNNITSVTKSETKSDENKQKDLIQPAVIHTPLVSTNQTTDSQETKQPIEDNRSVLPSISEFMSLYKDEQTDQLPQQNYLSAITSDVLDFYNAKGQLPEFYTFSEINRYKNALKNGIKNIKDVNSKLFIDHSVNIFSNQLLSFQKNNYQIIISLNPRQSTSFIRDNITGKLRTLSFAEIKEVILPLIQSESSEIQEQVLAILQRVHTSTLPTKVSKSTYPSVKQVLERHYYINLFKKYPITDILPVICAGNILLARYDDVYYKVSTKQPFRFETYKNGKRAPMTVNEFKIFLKDLRRQYNYAQLAEVNAEALKNKFFASNQQISAEHTDETALPKQTDISQYSLAQKIISFEEINPTIRIKQQPKSTRGPYIKVTNLLETPDSTVPMTTELETADFFFGPNFILPSFKAEDELNQLKTEYAQKYPENAGSVKIRNPIIDRRNRLYYKENNTTYIFSLDEDHPFFIKKTENRTEQTLKWVEVQQILTKVIPVSHLCQKYIQFFEKLYYSKIKHKRKREAKQLPSVQQVIETAKYQSLLAEKTVLQNINPIICANQIIMAKYGNAFYKITLDGAPSYGVYQDGKIRQMTLNEVRFISRYLIERYNAVYLMKSGANALLERYEKAVSPKQKFFEQQEQANQQTLSFANDLHAALKTVPLQTVSSETNKATTSSSEQIIKSALTDSMVTHSKEETIPSLTHQTIAESTIQYSAPQTQEDEIRQALAFWQESIKLRPDNRYQEQIEQTALNQQIATDIYQPINTTYIAQDDCLYTSVNGKKYIISLDLNMPYYRVEVADGTNKKIPVADFETVLNTIVPNVSNKKSIIRQFQKAYKSLTTQSVRARNNKRSWPTAKQVLVFNYLNQTSEKLSDISATICAGNIIIAKKGNVLYKITLSPTLTFTALQNGQIRPMNADEIQKINQELLGTYHQPVLQETKANGLKSKYFQQINKQQTPVFTIPDSIQYTPIIELLDFNNKHSLEYEFETRFPAQSQQEILTEQQSKITINYGSSLNLNSFLEENTLQINPYYHQQIQLLTHAIETHNPNLFDEKNQLHSYEPIITPDNFLHWKDGRKLYYISLDLKRPSFLEKDIKTRAYRIMSPFIIKKTVLDIFKNDIETGHTVLARFATAYMSQHFISPESKHLQPSLKQALLLAEKQLEFNNQDTQSDILPVLCENNTILARYNNVFYKLRYKESPVFEAWENGIIRRMTKAELNKIINDLFRSIKSYKLNNLGLNKRPLNVLYDNTATNNSFVNNQQEQTSIQQYIVQLSEETGIQAGTHETENIFGSLNPIKNTAKNDTNIVQETTPFFEDEFAFPDFLTLQKSLILKQKIAQKDENEIILSPTLCSDGKVHALDNQYHYVFSLDEKNVTFSKFKKATGTAILFQVENLNTLIADNFDANNPDTRLISEMLNKLYQKYQISPERYKTQKSDYPRFDQIIEFDNLTAQLNGTIPTDTILPCLCAGNIIYARYNQIYYKIKIKEPITFEALENNQIRSITADEFNLILNGIYERKIQHKISMRHLKKAFKEQSLFAEQFNRTAENIILPTPYTVPNRETRSRQILSELQKNDFNPYEYQPKMFENDDIEELKKALFPTHISHSAVAEFYQYNLNSFNFDAQIRIETLKRAIQNNNPDLKDEENHAFDMPAVWANDDRIHYKKGIYHYIISLRSGDVFFSVRNILNKQQRHIPFEDVKTILTEALKPYPELSQKILRILPNLYKGFFAKKNNRKNPIYTFPRFEQIEEEQKLSAQLQHIEPEEDIITHICSGNLLCAKYNNNYYRITISETPTFDVLENGVIRDMTAEEFHRILQDVAKNQIYRYLKKINISTLKNTFYRTHTYIGKARPQKSKLFKPSPYYESKSVKLLNEFIHKNVPPVYSELPLFSQILTGKNNTVDIPAIHCGDNCIYARKNGIYYKIDLSSTITFEKLYNNTIESMSRTELNDILSDLEQSYDEYYLMQLTTLNLPLIFDTTTQHTSELIQITEKTTDLQRKEDLPVKNPIISNDELTTPVKVALDSSEEQSVPMQESIVHKEDIPINQPDAVSEKPIIQQEETIVQTEKTVQQPIPTTPIQTTASKRQPVVRIASWGRKHNRILPIIQQNNEEDDIDSIEILNDILSPIKFETPKLLYTGTISDTIRPEICSEIRGVFLTDNFYIESEQKPHFNYLYKTYLRHQQIKMGKPNYFQGEDIISFDIPPVLCADNVLYEKRGKFVYQISLDEKRPKFVVQDLLLKTKTILPPKYILNMLNEWLKNEDQATELGQKLIKIYTDFVNNDNLYPQAAPSYPSIQDVYHYYAQQMMYMNKYCDKTKIPAQENFSIPATLCQDNQIIAKSGRTWYKITITDDEVLFEKKVKGADSFIIRENEFYQMLNDLGQQKEIKTNPNYLKFLKHLRLIYKNNVLPVFDYYKTDIITKKMYEDYKKRNFGSISDFYLRLKQQQHNQDNQNE